MLGTELEIKDFPETDYRPLIDYESWRVAVLAYCENTTLAKIKSLQKHEKTDEVFVLIQGECWLILAGDATVPEKLQVVSMLPGKVYNVKKGVWHNHILSKEGIVLIVENRDTNDVNSPIQKLSTKQLEELANICGKLEKRVI